SSMKVACGLLTVFLATVSICLAQSPALDARKAGPPTTRPYASMPLMNVKAIDKDWKDTSRDRDLPVKIYVPTNGDGPFPLIVFSHGLGGSREGYDYIASQWA